MDFSQIKLIVTDMDGTLLNSEGKVSEKFFALFKKLHEKSIHFCAASGRQHNSIISKLATIKDQIYVIAENGGIVKQSESTILSQFLNPKKVQELIPVLRTIAGANMVLCCDNAAYIESKDERFINLFQEYYHSFQQVEDVMKIAKTIPVFKIAVYHFDSSEKYIFPVVQQYKNDVLLKISGKHWVDISDENAHKGNALKAVQKRLNVSKEETLVFGDYHNDIEMMREAGMSFAMKNAHDDIKKIAKFTTESNDDFGVEIVLEKLVNQ